MINGILLIIAAVLFAVVYLFGGQGIVWLWIAAFYLAVGVIDLAVYYLKNRSRIRAADKKAAENAKEAAEARKQAESVKVQEQRKLISDTVKEEQNG